VQNGVLCFFFAQNVSPVEVSAFEAVDQHFGSGDIRGHGDVLHVAQAQQFPLVWLAGLASAWVAEEKQKIHFFISDAGGNLLAAAVSAGQIAMNGQASGSYEHLACAACGNQVVSAEGMQVCRAKLHKQFLFVVVCYESDIQKIKPSF
jgi:hypothetical protein